ncbi:Crp/Fnr family transcriptional regulator [Prevotella sp. OH937_COT-195]|uniref:Crp/Fnr family transcriptional regulator n=1 Tax=Prevotella sp. OH937_COT-195 TaxID=2491051 RepID=UPI000F649637|nr:Crp/Fnr family transcriptional regulator [Prevotella sp. OH937_COT-195]RRD02962.1 Crp/Fnr family transcriptional regulator [Prevotella sp. OH937_COT-195]
MATRDLTNKTRDIARELARKYSTMTHDELDILQSVLVPMKFAKGEMILKEGETCTNIYYIEKGLVRQFYFKNGKQLTEHMAVEGNIVMCIESLFREEPTKLQMEALETTIIYALPKARLEEVALHNVNMQILYRKILEESLILSQIHADLVRFESAQDRYRKMCKLQNQVTLRAPLVYIASYLQMTPETLSRVRSSTLLD